MSIDPVYAGERLKESPFHPRQKALNLREAWSSWNGYRFAEYYYDPEYEYFCIRNGCGTYDICPMQKYRVTGSDAAAMLDRMVTRLAMRSASTAPVPYCWFDSRSLARSPITRLTHYDRARAFGARNWRAVRLNLRARRENTLLRDHTQGPVGAHGDHHSSRIRRWCF